jgi:hypothetical protein
MTAAEGMSAASRAVTAKWTQIDARRLIALSLLPFVALVALHWSLLPLIRAGDYAQYLLHAQALAQGKAYGDIGYIFTDRSYFVGPRVQPPGLPLTILPVLAIFGRNWAALKLVMVLSAIAFLFVSGRDLSRRFDPWIAAGAVLITGVALEAAYATNQILTDLGFCACCWAVIYIADAPGEWTMKRVIGVSVLGAAAMSYRVAGIALVPATVIFGLMRLRSDGLRPLLPIPIWGALGLVAIKLFGIQAQFPTDQLMSPADILRRMLENLRKARYALAEAQLYLFPVNRANDAYHVLGWVATFVGAIGFLRREMRSYLMAFCIAYGGMLLLAPVAEPRYWWPLYPLLTAIALQGLVAIVRSIRPIQRFATPRNAFVVAACITLLGVVHVVRAPRPATLLGSPNVQSLFSMLRERGKTERIRVYFMNPRVLTWETGVPAMPHIIGDATANDLLQELRQHRITHVIAGDLGISRDGNRLLMGTIGKYPTMFREEYQNPAFRLLRFLPDSLPTRPDSAATAGRGA